MQKRDTILAVCVECDCGREETVEQRHKLRRCGGVLGPSRHRASVWVEVVDKVDVVICKIGPSERKEEVRQVHLDQECQRRLLDAE